MSIHGLASARRRAWEIAKFAWNFADRDSSPAGT
jgi:hypothetical protein